jgi:hypothetical protein
MYDVISAFQFSPAEPATVRDDDVRCGKWWLLGEVNGQTIADTTVTELKRLVFATYRN